MSNELNRSDLFEIAASKRNKFETLLRAFVETPTVSMERKHRSDVKRGVDLVVETFRSLGARTRVYRTAGNPVVHGAFLHSRAAPSAIVYNHMDVQPADGDDGVWKTDPFRMIVQDDRYFGRGTTDDKGPALAALLGAAVARDRDVPLNLHFVWEFEEEIGSPHFREGIIRLAERVRAESIVVSDSVWISRKRPSCCAGYRGYLGFRLTLRTGRTDAHSGEVGGAARNPIGELMKLACEMFDASTGRVKIPGFYKDVARLTPKEWNNFSESGFSVPKFKKDYRLLSLRTEQPLDVMKRIWATPTFEIHGLVGGHMGDGIKAIVPPIAEMRVSCRLVPHQKPEKIAGLISRFVMAKNPDVKIHTQGAVSPYLSRTTGPHADALCNAMEFAFGKRPVFVRGGGSIGAVNIMEEVFRCPVFFLGLSLPEHGYHAPNENFDWRQASGGIVAFVHYFHGISQIRNRG